MWFIWALCFGVRCSCGLMLTWFALIVRVLVNMVAFLDCLVYACGGWVVFVLSFKFAYLVILILVVGFVCVDLFLYEILWMAYY